MEKAIKLAIAGGWQWKRNSNEIIEYKIYAKEIDEVDFNDMLMDSKFWEGLGKSLNWSYEPVLLFDHSYKDSELQYEWHKFIDHIIAGGTADDFFKELLANE